MKNILFEAGDGQHKSKILSDGFISMSMGVPEYKSDCVFPVGCAGYFINSGARHFVSESIKLDDDHVFNMGRKIRYAAIFQPQGINVNFYKIIDKYSVEIKTYEKGIERVMLSCASGSTAVVFHLSMIKELKSPTTTKSEGGNLTFKYDKDWKNPVVEGPAEILFSGEINEDIFI